MLGIIFTSLIEMLEENVSVEFADEVISAAELPNDGAYTSVGYYPFEHMQSLLAVLCDKTGKSADAHLNDFGQFLFHKIAQAHGDVIRDKGSLIDMLEYLDSDIHVQVKKLYPDADLPTFSVIEKDKHAITLSYYSKRDLYALAAGLIQGAAEYFDVTAQTTISPMNTPHTYRISVEVKQASYAC